jgi:SAM-dependent methyltransferase
MPETSSSLPDFYDLIAPIYDRHWGKEFSSSATRQFGRHLAPIVAPRARILDLCCGSGRFAAFLGRSGYQVTGVDSSRELLAEAMERAPRARLVQADMTTFALPEKVDAAVCWYNSLNHSRDERELGLIFANVARYLKPSAPFLFDVISEENYVDSWDGDQYVLSADTVYELRYSYLPRARVARCRVRVRSRVNPRYIEAEAVSEQRPLDGSAIDRALRYAGLGVVFRKKFERARPLNGRQLILAKRL